MRRAHGRCVGLQCARTPSQMRLSRVLPPRRCSFAAGTSIPHEVLAVEREPHLARPKARQPETRAEALAREVRAVLVVDVPERRLAEDAPGVRKLEQDGRAGIRLRPGSDEAEERADVRHVLERVAAYECPSRELGVLRSESLGDERDVAVRPRSAGRVDPDPTPAGEVTERPEEGCVGPAPDFDDVSAREPVSVDPFPCEGSVNALLRGEQACVSIQRGEYSTSDSS